MCAALSYTNLELFSGSGGFTKVSRSYGFNCLSIDNRFRRGTCEPDLKLDISKIKASDIPVLFPFILWVGLPCDIWSYASGSAHWIDNKPSSKKCLDHIDLLFHVMNLIDEIQPYYFFIENPRGRLRHYKPFLEWLDSKKGTTYTITLSSYGHCTTKPTNLFSNCPGLSFLPLAPYGRGAVNQVRFDNLTKVQRQKTPENLYLALFNQMKNLKLIK